MESAGDVIRVGKTGAAGRWAAPSGDSSNDSNIFLCVLRDLNPPLSIEYSGCKPCLKFGHCALGGGKSAAVVLNHPGGKGAAGKKKHSDFGTFLAKLHSDHLVQLGAVTVPERYHCHGCHVPGTRDGAPGTRGCRPGAIWSPMLPSHPGRPVPALLHGYAVMRLNEGTGRAA